MKKILDILLIAAIVFLLVNIFWNKQAEQTGISIKFSETTYSIPASVVVKVNNSSTGTLQFHSCDDIKILYSGTPVVFDNSVCKEIELLAGEKTDIEYQSQYKKFEKIGEYKLKANIDGKEFFDNAKLKHKGTFSQLFTGLVYAPIYNLVVFLIELFSYSFGWAVIGVTILIRLLLLYPQHKMMISQRRMQAIQPKIKEIQEKYKGKQQELGMKIMELYKKEKVNPFGSCGFLFIQIPILFVIYRIILGIQDPSNMYYIYNALQSFDLSKVDFEFYGLHLLQDGGLQWIILALSVALIQFIQIKLSLSYNKKAKETQKKWVVLEKKKNDSSYSSLMPDPEMMNKFMLFVMPVMVGVFTYTLFAGIGIYWGISTLFMLVQQLIVNKMLKKSS